MGQHLKQMAAAAGLGDDMGNNGILTMADAMGQWAQIGAHNHQAKLIDMKIKQAEREQAQQDQLQSLYAGGQRPTADQIYSIDPEMGMKYEKMQADNQPRYDQKKHAALSGIANDALTKLQQSGITDPAGQEQFIRQYQANMKPYIQNVLGLPATGDMSLDQVKMLAGSQVAQSDQDWIVVNDAQNGAFMLNKKDGSVKPIEHGGRQLRPPQYDPALQGDIMAAREGQKGVKATNAIGQEYYDTQGNVSGGRIGGQYAPNPALPPNIDISPNASPEDRAMLEAIAKQTGGNIRQNGPVLSQSPADATAEKKKAEALVASQNELPGAVAEADYADKLLEELSNHPGLEGAVGLKTPQGYLGISGTNEADFIERMKQIEGQQFLNAFNKLKGGGQITEIEGVKATQAMARLGRSQTEKEFKKSVEELRGILRSGKERAISKAKGATSSQSEQPTKKGVTFLGFD